ncbi:DUF5384 family protein [Serratia marcescens]|uniref:DUF5384 family protein n=1 Tax=Serratia marcescens TaxID=615 RepID=UPI001EEF9B8A|nr:DUF5384 family protein [Serratia marcescens]ULH10486.1 DUF5384 family protein [Serratia marcescens]
MKVRHHLFPATLFLLSMTGHAADLQQQLAAVAQAEQEGKQQEQRQQNARQAEQARILRAEQQRQAHAAALRADAQKRRDAAQQAERNRKQAVALADKQRNQSYEDELRALNIQKQKLELEKETMRVKRENDFIDQELKAKAAHTDVVQSEADANRDLSSGGKALLQSEGKAREKKASGWFH